MQPTVFDLMPATSVDDGDLAPPRRFGAAGALGSYVACGMWEGRPLFAILADGLAQGLLDEEPDPLGRLAADTLVRDALERFGDPAVMPFRQVAA